VRVIVCALEPAFAVNCVMSFALQACCQPEIAKMRALPAPALFLDVAAVFEDSPMAQPVPQEPQDPRAVAILAKNIYREFRAGGFNERDVMALAGELLSLVASDVKSRKSDGM